MASYNVALPDISASETARYAGLRSQQDFPAQLIKDACFDAKVLAAPKAVWELYDYDCITRQIASPTPLRLEGRSITGHLAGCHKVVILAVTIGNALETRASHLFSIGSYTAGLLLDAAGTTAVEAAADKVNEFIAMQAEKEGLAAISRFSPGYGDWSICIQPKILELAGANLAGIDIAPSCMLIPRKSITAIIGLKHGSLTASGDKGCAGRRCLSCPQHSCIARKES